MIQTEPYLVQLVHTTVDKVSALKLVAKELRVDRNEVLAIGDNLNDIEMLKWAGIGVAMANGAPEAIEAADFVTDHHDADGAATAIRKLVVEGLSAL